MFDQARPFTEELAAVVVQNRIGFIDRSGKLVIKPQFDVYRFDANAESGSENDFCQGRVVVYLNKKCQLIDKTGQPIKTENMSYIGRHCEDLAPFSYDGVKYGYIDLNGKTIIEPKFKAASIFSEGLAAVQTGEIDKKDGDYKYKEVIWSYIDRRGKVVLSNCKWLRARAFKDGIAGVTSHLKPSDVFEYTGFIDKSGTYVIPPKFDTVSDFRDGRAAMRTGRNLRGGYIDRNGKIVIEEKYFSTGNFSEGLAGVKVSHDSDFGYIDTSGAYVIKPQFVFPHHAHANTEFHEGLAVIPEPFSAKLSLIMEKVGLALGFLLFACWTGGCFWIASNGQKKKTA